MAEKTPGADPDERDEAGGAASPAPNESPEEKPAPRKRGSGARKKPAGTAGKQTRKRSPRKPAAEAGASSAAEQAAEVVAADDAKKPREKAAAAPGEPAEAETAAVSAAEVTAEASAAGQTAVTAVTVEAPAAATGAAAPPEAGAATGITHALAPVGRVLTSKRAPRIRSWVAFFLVVVSVLAVMVSVLALWSRSIIFDTDTYVKVVAPVAEDPQVREAVSSYVATKAIEATDLKARIEDALPSDAKVLAAPLTASLERFLVDEIDKFLGTELAQRLWVDINRFAHEQLITALQDENRYVTVGRNDVKLNLLPIVAVALQKLEAKIPQLLGRDVTLPQIDPDTAPEEIRTLLQDALGRELPADFGSITLLEGSQGYEAKQALRLFNDLVILVVIVTVVLIVAAVLVSVRRWRTALWLGLGALIGFVAARVIEVQLEKAVVDAVKSEGGAAVARSIVSSAIGSLNSFFVWIAVAGVIVAVAAFLAGKPGWLDAMGRGFAKLFGVASDLSAPDTGAGRWMAAHLDLLRVGGVAAAIVVLLFVTGSLSAVLVVVVALAVYELALSAYAIGVPREPPDGPADEPPAPAA